MSIIERSSPLRIFFSLDELLCMRVNYRVVGIKQLACGVVQVCEWLQAGITVFQDQAGSWGTVRALQPCGQTLHALLQCGH